MTTSEPLACPRCATGHSLDERFCPRCGMPLVYGAVASAPVPVDERHERARKIAPQYAEGDLVRVAGGRNQAEAEFIQNLLLEEGVPSTLRRSAGFDVPDFLAAGPRDVLVPRSGAMTAREVLLEAEIVSERPSGPGGPTPALLLAGLLSGLVLIALIAWIGSELIS